jgi:hypothetical protein
MTHEPDMTPNRYRPEMIGFNSAAVSRAFFGGAANG